MFPVVAMWMENVSHRLTCLDTWSLAGVDAFEGCGTLEMPPRWKMWVTGGWRLDVYSQALYCVGSPIPDPLICDEAASHCCWQLFPAMMQCTFRSPAKVNSSLTLLLGRYLVIQLTFWTPSAKAPEFCFSFPLEGKSSVASLASLTRKANGNLEHRAESRFPSWPSQALQTVQPDVSLYDPGSHVLGKSQNLA